MGAVTNRLASRRRVLKGMLGGSAVTVGLPFLDCFLNENGTALAASGQELPVCFGTWFNGLGLNPGYWEPKTIGPDYEVTHQLEPLRQFRDRINVYSGMRVYLDGHTPKVHDTGAVTIIGGGIPGNDTESFPSIDTLVADHIGTRSRYRSLVVNCVGERISYSRRSASATNPAEPSPAALYAQIFGPEFQDPNAAEFKSDPKIMARQSVLSAVGERRKDFMRDLGATDRTRMDEYFTALRELEGQLGLQLEKPAPLEACTIPGAEDEGHISHVMEEVRATHKMFSGLLAHALACGQTRVVNVVLDNANGNLRQNDSPVNFHINTHEEPVDPALGYQKNVGWFMEKSFECLNDLFLTFDSIREGDKTLLDRVLMMYGTDTGFAKIHSLENIPMFTFGSGGGRMKTGIHVPASGDTTSRVGLTVQQALGIPIQEWGTESNRTSRTITEVLA